MTIDKLTTNKTLLQLILNPPNLFICFLDLCCEKRSGGSDGWSDRLVQYYFIYLSMC